MQGYTEELDLGPESIHKYSVVFGKTISKRNKVWSVEQACEKDGVLILRLFIKNGSREPLIRSVTFNPKKDSEKSYDVTHKILSWAQGHRWINLVEARKPDESFSLAT